MIPFEVLVDWILRASVRASLVWLGVVTGSGVVLPASTARGVTPVFARALAAQANGDLALASIETALAFTEGGNQAAIVGDHGRSFCALQVNLPNGARTREGWSGADLLADPSKCAAAGMRLVVESILRGPSSCPLCVYARGRDTVEARRLSAARMKLARRLVADVALVVETVDVPPLAADEVSP